MTDFTGHLISSFLVAEPELNGRKNPHVVMQRKSAIDNFEALGFPTTKVEDGRAHVWTPVTQWSRMPSSAWKKKTKKKK